MKDQSKISQLELEIGGTRPTVTITSDNRGKVRQWLTANGAAYSQIASLPLSQLALLYNHPNALAEFLSEAESEEEAPKQEAKSIQSSPKQSATMPSQTAQQKALQALLDTLTPQALPIDREEVRRIVKEEAGLQPLRVTLAQAHKTDVEVGICHKSFPQLVAMIGAGCHVWLAGPAGTGKTTAAAQVAKALDLPWYFNGAIDSEHKLLGFTDAQGRCVSRPFREAYTKGGVYLFDEVDASLPGALLAFNAALANGHCDFPDGCHERHADFRCIAAANTYGHGATHDYVGRAKQDGAFLDRFAALSWPVDETLERTIALACIADTDTGGKWVSHVQNIRAKVAAGGIKQVVSPRASIHGCKLLQAGLKWAAVEEATIRKGMPAETWSQISK